MGKTDHWIRESKKSGLASEESYIVGRGGQVFLRILGKEPNWQVMTATANEDDGAFKVFPDRARFVETAFTIGHRRNTNPIRKADFKGREYVLICSINQVGNVTDEHRQEIEDFLKEFFCIFDDDSGIGYQARDEMIDIYQSLSGEDAGDSIYLSDGVWLSSDGSVEDRGR